MTALATADEDDLRRRAWKIRDCCVNEWVVVCEYGTPRIDRGYCRQRACPTCARIRAAKASERIQAIVDRMDAVRFVTLTIQPGERDTGAMIDHLLDSFRRLRRSVLWKRAVTGGVATVEVTSGSSGSGRHVHLHALIDGDFIDVRDLQAAWATATGDSLIVWIQAVPSRAQAARYISKYLAKPAGSSLESQAFVRDVTLAFHGRRTLLTFGAAHGVKVEPTHPELADRPAGRRIVSAAAVRTHAARGVQEALAVQNAAKPLPWPIRNAMGVACVDDLDDDAALTAADLDRFVTACTEFRAWFSRNVPKWIKPASKTYPPCADTLEYIAIRASHRAKRWRKPR